MSDESLENQEPEAPTETLPAAPIQEPEAPAVPVGPLISDGLWSVATSTWIHNHIRNSPIAQSTEAWQHLGLVLPQLRGYLESELAKLGLVRPAN